MQDDTEDISDFLRDTQTDLNENRRAWAKDTLYFDEKAKLYLLPHSSYSNFSGAAVEVSNSRAFLQKYPGVVTTVGGGFNSVSTGVAEEALVKMGPEQFEALQEDVDQVANRYCVLDDGMFSKVELEAQDKAWKNYIRYEFLCQLRERFEKEFPDDEALLEQLIDSDNLRAFFEQERQDAGQEYVVETGLLVLVSIGEIVNNIEPKIIQQFLHPEQNRMGLALENYLLEQLIEESHDFSCVMAPAPKEFANAVITWGKQNIDDDDLYDGEEENMKRESEIHVTVKFGLTDSQASEELLRIIEETQPFDIEVGVCSLFEAQDYDVVKFSVDSEALRELNRRVSELPNEDAHPKYSPHMTVAYVKKGRASDLVGKRLFATDVPAENTFRVKALEFSKKDEDGPPDVFFLGRPNLEPAEAMA